MALANVVSNMTNFVKNLGVVEFGASNFMRTEDQFISSSKFAGTQSLNENNPQEVIIACKNKKRRVCGILNEGIKLSGEARWEELFGGGITSLGGSLINMVNKGAQYVNGSSIQQPWMNRKFWNSTKPFSFTFSFNFIADENDGQIDVWQPTQALLSFVFPRKLGSAKAILEKLDQTKLLNMQQSNSKGGSGLGKATIETFTEMFAIPGPTIGYTGDGSSKGTGLNNDQYDGQGDAVTLVIGNLFAFGGVYLEKVDVEYSPNMDASGYPLWAKCTVTATIMDVNTCETNGDFMVNQFAEKQAALSSLMDSIKTLTSDFAEGVTNVFQTTTKGLGR